MAAVESGQHRITVPIKVDPESKSLLSQEEGDGISCNNSSVWDMEKEEQNDLEEWKAIKWRGVPKGAADCQIESKSCHRQM